jgi:maleylpyruvate isomerase
MLSEVMVADTQPLQNLGPQFLHAPDDAAKRADWARHWIEAGLHAFETLARSTAGRFSFQDQLSFADLCLIPQLYNARRYHVAVDENFPLLAQIEKEALALPSGIASHPDRFQPSLKP